ncbi:sulfite exporter TauE/SafE family protein [Sphingomonas sp. RB3P16]|uniref:sulfite exporter TauE/SafE family protein n=1 Tax=Parasphingomonas frigoris TaxID=3096163 RepID=UPI002FC753F4
MTPLIEYVLLIVGAFAAAAISGSAGFGGALLLLPLLNQVVGVTEAVPLLTIVQIIGNAARAGMGWRHIRWRFVLLFLAAAIPFSMLGALSFASLPTALVTRIVGIAILLFVILKATGMFTFKPSRRVLVIGGGVTGLLSGLVGSAGPLGAAVFLSLGLPPIAYVASEAVAAIAMHGAKTIVYGATIDLGPAFWPLAIAMGLAMIAGTWVGRSLIMQLPVERFRKVVMVLLALIAIEMIAMG